ncbi:hypothetical protein B4N89_46745 [Embleya scabrispora]|uniref:Uncharacterized protein n=1 Tax=Embleya scabrispora TaxID=159449 RepID=A0A1T3NI44_9ACTN|nr:hypothetical protein [Embleya scabrispora]OPC76517.1 hypothetical protein B4N89_46745 [Embleya scabrispora]
MNITKTAIAVVTSAAAFAGTAWGGAGVATADILSFEFTVKVQNQGNGEFLDHTHSPHVQTAPSNVHQDWTFKEVGETREGVGIYTIRWGDVSCLTDLGSPKGTVLLTHCDRDVSSQRWIVDVSQEYTTIVPQDDESRALQTNDHDAYVTLTPLGSAPTPRQSWTLLQE